MFSADCATLPMVGEEEVVAVEVDGMSIWWREEADSLMTSVADMWVLCLRVCWVM